MSSDYLKPGSMLGIYGGGQLGRMLAMAARRMDYRTVTLDPDPDSPAAQGQRPSHRRLSTTMSMPLRSWRACLM